MKTCTQCGTPISSDSPEGLCARCLLSVAMKDDPGVTLDPSGKDDRSSGGPRSSAPAIDITDAAEVSRRLQQFEILELLGRGGMGVVYKARQIQLDRIVALKILPPAESASPGFIERFRREAKSLAMLNHPNIVSVHDFGESNGLHYFVMEFVDGPNLRQMFLNQRLTPAEALSVVPKICEALQFAHEEGVVHRDIKPENILIDGKGRVKIADFGLAKLLGRAEVDPRLTVSGATLGTPRYMAPEQMDKPESVDHRADIYSLGVVFYEMLTGEVPMGRFAPPSKKVQIDVRLDEIVLHALERDVELRYQHASEMKTEVEVVCNTPSRVKSPELVPVKRWPAWVWWTLLVLVALPFMQLAELNRDEEMAGHGAKFALAGEIKLALLALGAYAAFKLVDLWRSRTNPMSHAAFSQPWPGISAALFGVCIIAVGPFPHVEWLRQTMQVTAQKVVNTAGTTVELAPFSQTLVKHGMDFWEGRAIAAICLLAGAFVLLGPRRPRWNLGRSVVLSMAGVAIICQLLLFDLHAPRNFGGTTDFVEFQAKTDPTYRQFRDDYRRAEAADAQAKNVPAETLGQGVAEALEKPNSREAALRLLQRLNISRRGFYSEYKVADGGTLCAYAAIALFVLGMMMLGQTMRASPPAFGRILKVADTWSGILLLVPCVIFALAFSWVENDAWIPPGAVNPIIIDVPFRRFHPIGIEFWQGRVIAAACAAAILILILAAVRLCRPSVRAAALIVTGIVSIASVINFANDRLMFVDVSWHDFHAVAQRGPSAADSSELRSILARRPQYIQQLAELEKDVRARIEKLPPDSPEARKLAGGPQVSIYQNPQNAPELCALLGLGLVLLGIRDGVRIVRPLHRKKKLAP